MRQFCMDLHGRIKSLCKGVISGICLTAKTCAPQPNDKTINCQFIRLVALNWLFDREFANIALIVRVMCGPEQEFNQGAVSSCALPAPVNSTLSKDLALIFDGRCV